MNFDPAQLGVAAQSNGVAHDIAKSAICKEETEGGFIVDKTMTKIAHDVVDCDGRCRDFRFREELIEYLGGIELPRRTGSLIAGDEPAQIRGGDANAPPGHEASETLAEEPFSLFEGQMLDEVLREDVVKAFICEREG